MLEIPELTVDPDDKFEVEVKKIVDKMQENSSANNLIWVRTGKLDEELLKKNNILKKELDRLNKKGRGRNVKTFIPGQRC